MYRTEFWTLLEKARVGWSERTASKHVYYQLWNRSPVHVGCMRQVLGNGALGWPRGMGWGRRWEGGSGWGTYANPWLIHVNVWQKPLQYCKVISLQLIKIKEKNNILPQSLLYQNPLSLCMCSVVPTLCDPMGYSLPGSFVHGVLQVRILAWIATSFSRGSSWPRDWGQVFCVFWQLYSLPLAPPGKLDKIHVFSLIMRKTLDNSP